VPRGLVHAYTNSGGTVASILILVTPSGIHERFFAEAGERINGQSAPLAPPDLPRLARIARTYGIEMLPPQEGERKRNSL
jgi:hypothetical protein